MKISIPASWGWYVAVAIIFGPMVLIWAMDTDWIARMVGVSFYIILLPFVPLCVSVTRRKDYFGSDSPIYRKLKKNHVDNCARFLLLLFAISALYFLTIPFVKDIILIANNTAPIERTAYVAHTRSLSANISEEVVLDTYPELSDQDDLTAWYFAPRHIMTGNTYTFFILPHSRIIVEAIPVEIINQ